MSKKPIYTLEFSRDFSLAIVEIWVRAETTNEKKWTTEKQPFLPYIVAEKTGQTVNLFYDQQGVDWVSKLLISQAKENRVFFSHISDKFAAELQELNPLLRSGKPLILGDLQRLLMLCERVWVWFEAAWWLWKIPDHNEYGLRIPQEFRTIRDETQDFVQVADALVKSSLSVLYPDLKQYIHVISFEEIQSGEIPDMAELAARDQGYFYVADTLFVGKSRLYIEELCNIQFERTTVNQNVTEIKGQSAYNGVVRGHVKILYGTRQIEKVNFGDIIVSPMTMPDILPAMQKAAAFVTDEGGIMCHAAIIAREMKKPCIIGTKIATKVLKDGDMVEMDSEKGIVKIIKRS